MNHSLNVMIAEVWAKLLQLPLSRFLRTPLGCGYCQERRLPSPSPWRHAAAGAAAVAAAAAAAAAAAGSHFPPPAAGSLCQLQVCR